jgi:hypothetical protein
VNPVATRSVSSEWDAVATVGGRERESDCVEEVRLADVVLAEYHVEAGTERDAITVEVSETVD